MTVTYQGLIKCQAPVLDNLYAASFSIEKTESSERSGNLTKVT